LDNSEGNKLTLKTTCSVTLQVLDSLEYIHSQGYVHKDVKGSNLLVGLGLDGQHLVHLVDYGLSSKYHVSGLHKQYVHDMRWAHEGTMEYTSRDAHIGCSSRRGDLEVLFYNLIEWLGGSLPWDRECASPQVTKTAKFLAFRQMAKFLRICFRGQKFPMFLLKFMKYVNDLMFEEEPDYDYLRGIVYQEMTSAKIKLDMKLEFKLARLTDPKEELEILNPDLLYGPSKKPPSERVSAVFDTTCVSATSWERQRDDRWALRSQNSLENPTQAMKDILEMIERGTTSSHFSPKSRKRTKSVQEEAREETPAMLEVMKLRQSKSMVEKPSWDKKEEEKEKIIQKIKNTKMVVEVEKSQDMKKSKMVVEEEKTQNTKKVKMTEVEKLQLDEPPLVKRRTRQTRTDADQSVLNRELRTNLRAAFDYGFGPVRNLLRSVSLNLPKIF